MTSSIGAMLQRIQREFRFNTVLCIALVFSTKHLQYSREKGPVTWIFACSALRLAADSEPAASFTLRQASVRSYFNLWLEQMQLLRDCCTILGSHGAVSAWTLLTVGICRSNRALDDFWNIRLYFQTPSADMPAANLKWGRLQSLLSRARSCQVVPSFGL